VPEKPIRRWTLRELLNNSERHSRDLIDSVRKEILPAMRDTDKLLNRRQPNESALQNSIRTVLYQTSEINRQLTQLDEIYKAIGRAAKRELDERA
jgi:hypothetical protein